MTSVDRARQALGARLKQIREDAGFNGRAFSHAAAAATGRPWHWSKTSRIEQGKQRPSKPDLDVWCSVCDAAWALPSVKAALDNLEAQWAEWRRLVAAGHASRQQRGVKMDAAAEVVRCYGAAVLPGIVQTEAYARAALRTCIQFLGTVDDLDAAVAARLRRRKALQAGMTRFAVLVHESVLHAAVGDVDVMLEQLSHLADLTSQAAPLSLGVVPLRCRWVYTTTGFTLYDTKRALVETISAELTINTPDELVLYERAWEQLSELAVHGKQAHALIGRAIGAHRLDRKS